MIWWEFGINGMNRRFARVYYLCTDYLGEKTGWKGSNEDQSPES